MNSEALNKIVEYSPFFFYSARQEGSYTLTYLSQNAEKIIGFKTEQVINQPDFWLDHIHQEDVNSFRVRIAGLKLNKQMIFDYRFRTKNDSFIWLRDTMRKIFDESAGHECIICSLQDITEHKEDEIRIDRYIEEIQYSQKAVEEHAGELNLLNAKLSESETALKDLNASKDRFFSIIAHDLRSPISALLGYSDFLVDDFDSLEPEEIKEFSEHINTVSKSLTELLNNLLDWSRIQVGTMQFEPEFLQPAEIVHSVLKLLKANARKKDIRIINNIDPELKVFGDENMMHTILRNLISNAIKFTNQSGTIEVNQDISDNEAAISVRDNGVGMDEDTFDKLFRIDVNVTRSGTDNEKGTGLGLILCKELVEKNGGHISVTSTQGEGSTFRFTVPLKENR